MERWVDQPNGYWKSVHRLKQPNEIAPLEREQLVERLAPRFLRLRQNHFLNRALPLDALLRMFEILEEHMLGTAQADAFRTHLERHFRIVRRVCVRAHADTAYLVGPFHERSERLRWLRANQIDLARVHRAIAAVESCPFAFANRLAIGMNRLFREIDAQFFRAHDAALAPAARHH